MKSLDKTVKSSQNRNYKNWPVASSLPSVTQCSPLSLQYIPSIPELIKNYNQLI